MRIILLSLNNYYNFFIRCNTKAHYCQIVQPLTKTTSGNVFDIIIITISINKS